MSTSGEFHVGAISQIVVNRSERQRKELPDIEGLAQSIAAVGLIHPILITRDMTLVAGERRLEACKHLGWTAIPYQFTDEIDEHELQALELEENVKRVDLPWQDKCDSVKRYHELRLSQDSSWTQEKTADALGVSKTNITKYIAVADELAKGNERILAAPKLTTAVGIIERTNQRKAAESRLNVTEIIASKAPEANATIKNIDFLKWLETYTGPPFNLIHCDFPYGIGAGGFNQGGAATHGGYSDTADDYWRLVQGLADANGRAVAESAHLIFWFSIRYYSETIERLSAAGWRVNPMPLIWHRSDNSGILPDPQRGPRQVYETALLASRGDRKIIQAVSNLFPHPSVKDRHMSEKPQPMLQYFFRMLVDDSSRVLDPTCGSGSSIRAAHAMKAKIALGLEINPEFANIAQIALAEELKNAKG